MRRCLLGISFLFICVHLVAQDQSTDKSLRYLEDQLYLSLSYNILLDKPSIIAQNGFSGGFSIGFVKDIPFTIKGDLGIGIGVGYSYNAYIQNLKISKSNSQTSFFEIGSGYTKNRFATSALELPFEIRWRNSTIDKYKFWRVYGGFKISYLLGAKSIYSDTIETITTKNIDEFNKIQYGLTLATGFSTWNLYVYYGLNSILNEADLNGNSLFLRDFKVGLKFYMM